MAVLRSSEEWQQLLAEQVASGLSIRAFCQHRQIAVSTFLARKKRASSDAGVNARLSVSVSPQRRTRASSPQPPQGTHAPSFVPLTVLPSPTAGAEITVIWGSSELRLPAATAPEWVAQLLLTLTRGA